MGTRSHPLIRSAYLGLGLLLLVSGWVRADPVRAEPEAPAPPLVTPAAAAEPAELPSCGEFPSGPHTNAWSTWDELALGSVTANTATPWDASPTSEAVYPGPPTTRLVTTETSGLLMCQGLLLIALVRKRRKWAAAFLAVVALSRSGLSAIAEVVGFPKAGATSASPPSEPTTALETRLGLPSAATSERAYAGLLRRLAGEAAAPNLRSLISVPSTPRNPQPGTTSSVLDAGFSSIRHSTFDIPLLPVSRSLIRHSSFVIRHSIAFALFARPPPARHPS